MLKDPSRVTKYRALLDGIECSFKKEHTKKKSQKSPDSRALSALPYRSLCMRVIVGEREGVCM